ncbi:MAG: sensor histidine kinase [uncultured Thermomicrobiales bacterium]|uniref:histidine kinase n=1 Tax=uncultured Thermomicrobiales bacterium TaxID=1645740 RepID=A0A6J4USW0_9BACT|nr:MAG: sensor histidine kinase [uncultured Thermomicrobiales bacterium]
MITPDDLRPIPLFAGLSDDDLAWVAGEGREVLLAPGDALFVEGGADVAFFVLLEGELQVTKLIGREETVLASHRPGAFTGEVPLLTGTPYIATVRALVPSRVLRLEPEAFYRTMGTCRDVATAVLRTVAQRVQSVGSTLQQQEKLAALGRLSAGLAHELNNPAAAARRAGALLCRGVHAVAEEGLALARLGLAPAQLDALAALRREATAPARVPPALDPLARSDREDALAGWLDDRGVADAWDLAPAFVDAGIDADRLAAAVAALPPAALGPALAWLAADLSATALVGEVEQATTRIAELVGAVKSYSHLDRAPEEEVDVREGLKNTLTMLGHKLRANGVTVTREDDPDVPRIPAYPGELNQVWTNLLDNAIDALGEGGPGGRITVRTAREGDRVLVEIGDDGPGMPPEVRERIFEPFFTTKPMGEGTGLGLDVTRRIVVERHHGDIRVESAPGDTRFQVRLPMAGRQNRDADGAGGER